MVLSRDAEKVAPYEISGRQPDASSPAQVAQVAQIFGGDTLRVCEYVGTESVSAEFSTTASEPYLRFMFMFMFMFM